MAKPTNRKKSARKSKTADAFQVDKTAASKADAPSTKKVSRIGRAIRGYDRKAVDALLRQKENEIAEVQSQLHRNKVLLEQAQSERVAFLNSLDVAARGADELVQEATARAVAIRIEAEEDAEQVRQVAEGEANELIAASKLDLEDIEKDKAALSNYQNELSAYLYKLGQYLMETSVDPTIALPIDEQPAITGAPRVDSEETIVLAEIEASAEEDFAEFFSDDIAQDKSRDWILKD